MSKNGNKTLKTLDLSWNSLGTSVEKLFHALTKTTSLDALYLEHNNIPSTACVSIAKTLTKNTSLKVLRLDNNPINDVASLCSIVQSFEPSQKFVRQLGLEGVMKNLGPKLSRLGMWTDVWNDESKRHDFCCEFDLANKREKFLALDLLGVLKYSNKDMSNGKYPEIKFILRERK